jgi:hypothetical protein
MKCTTIKVYKKPYFDASIILDSGSFSFSFYKNIDVCLVSKTFGFCEIWSFYELILIKFHGTWQFTFF